MLPNTPLNRLKRATRDGAYSLQRVCRLAGTTALRPSRAATSTGGRSPLGRKLLCAVKGFGVAPSSAPMVMDCSGRINPAVNTAARRFRVDPPAAAHEVPVATRTGQADQDLVELAGDVALQAADDLPAAESLSGAPDDVVAGVCPVV